MSILTPKGSVGPSLQVHFTVAPLAHLFGVVADVVAAVLAAAEADALLEAVRASALEGEAHVVPVHQRVHKQVHRSLVFALHHFHKIWKYSKTTTKKKGLSWRKFNESLKVLKIACLNAHFLPQPARR